MANNMIPISQARNKGPGQMLDRLRSGSALSSNFADNVADAFPRLSIKGKVFRVRVDGQEAIAKDPNTGYPLAALDVVLINGSKPLAKTYYKDGYVEGDMKAPDCWSLDSIRPDPSVANKINPTCQDCPFNAFGSRITPDGKQAKECSDSRRIAVAMPHELLDEMPHVYLMRVPQSSLKNLKNYTLDTLARNGYEPGGCISRMTFDPAVAYPKVQFEFVEPVTDEEFDAVIELASSPGVTAMLKAPDFDLAASAANAVKTQVVEPNKRQAPPVTTPDQTGFSAGQLQGEEVQHPGVPADAQPRRRQAQAQAVPEQQEEEVQLIELPDGEGWLNPLTGEVTPLEAKPAEPQIDPDVIPVAGGRFYNKALGKFVASQFKDAAPVSAVPPVEEPAKKPAAKRASRVKTTPAAAQEPVQQAEQAAKPEQKVQAKPGVVTASPKLEALLSNLVNKAPSGNA